MSRGVRKFSAFFTSQTFNFVCEESLKNLFKLKRTQSDSSEITQVIFMLWLSAVGMLYKVLLLRDICLKLCITFSPLVNGSL